MNRCVFDKNQHPVMIKKKKNTQKTRNRELPQLDKEYEQKNLQLRSHLMVLN